MPRASRDRTRRGNYVHEAFLETILTIVRLWPMVASICACRRTISVNISRLFVPIAIEWTRYTVYYTQSWSFTIGRGRLNVSKFSKPISRTKFSWSCIYNRQPLFLSGRRTIALTVSHPFHETVVVEQEYERILVFSLVHEWISSEIQQIARSQ